MKINIQPRNPRYYAHEKADKGLNIAFWTLITAMVGSWLFILGTALIS